LGEGFVGAREVKSREGKESDMKLLVSAASRHGAATEVAEEIGKRLRESLQERDERDSVVVDVRPAERVDSVEDYDAVVLGSAVYAGRGLEAARDLASEHAEALAERPM